VIDFMYYFKGIVSSWWQLGIWLFSKLSFEKIPPGRSFLPKPPFQVFDLASCFFSSNDYVHPAEVNCSRGECWRTSHLLKSSKKVCLLFKVFSKDMKKLEKNFWNNFALSINIKKWRNYASRSKWRFKIKGIDSK